MIKLMFINLINISLKLLRIKMKADSKIP